MRYAWALMLLSLVVQTATAGDITYNVEGTPVVRTVNTQQTARLGRLKDRNNQATGQTLTTNQFLRDTVDACLKNQDEQLSAVEAPDACATFHANTPAEQATALTTYFGGKNPCP
jgi:hypothetical protein